MDNVHTPWDGHGQHGHGQNLNVHSAYRILETKSSLRGEKFEL
jgi:hypothetical protein